MEIVSEIGVSTLNGLSYLGSLASLGARAVYYTLVAPFQGKQLRLQRAISQAMETGVRALPILSLITIFIGLILALQAAYQLRQRIRQEGARGKSRLHRRVHRARNCKLHRRVARRRCLLRPLVWRNSRRQKAGNGASG